MSNKMNVSDFAKSHNCSNDWIVAMLNSNKEATVLNPGEKGTYSGYHAVVKRHYIDGMYEIILESGLVCVAAEHFISVTYVTAHTEKFGETFSVN